MESLNKGIFFEMIFYNQYNQIAADQWNVWICTRGWGIFENSCVDSDSREKYGVNEIADQYIVCNHSKRGYFSK